MQGYCTTKTHRNLQFLRRYLQKRNSDDFGEKLFYDCKGIINEHRHRLCDKADGSRIFLSGKLLCGYRGSMTTAETERVRRVKCITIINVSDERKINAVAIRKVTDTRNRRIWFSKLRSNAFYNHRLLYDDKILIFHNADTNCSAVIKERIPTTCLRCRRKIAEKEQNSLEVLKYKQVLLGWTDKLRTLTTKYPFGIYCLRLLAMSGQAKLKRRVMIFRRWE